MSECRCVSIVRKAGKSVNSARFRGEISFCGGTLVGCVPHGVRRQPPWWSTMHGAN